MTSPAPAGAGTPLKNGDGVGRPIAAGLGVEAGEAQRAADGIEQHDRPAEAVQSRHRPQIEHRSRRHAEADEIRQAVEFGAKARGRFEQPGDASVETVKDAGDDDRKHGADEIAVHREAHRRHPGAQRQQGQDVRDHAVERQIGEPMHPRPPHPARSPSHCSAPLTAPSPFSARTPVATAPARNGRRGRFPRPPSAARRPPLLHKVVDNKHRPVSQNG